MFQFVYWLKAIAAVLITNSHYADIWPISSLAAGGHLGNCIFFLVSGFCLSRVKDPFPRWYLNRIVRIYPAVWVAVAINLMIGFFHISSVTGFVACFFYPTWYHFVASIMLLYAVYYLVRKLQYKYQISNRFVLTVTWTICAAVYLFLFDKSWYHIDRVEENWVRFQFWISMMMGASLADEYEKIPEKTVPAEWLGLAILFAGYFAAKMLVSRVQALSTVQFLSPMLLIILVHQIGVMSIKLEKKGFWASFEKRAGPIKLLASITLEIYLVQNVIIQRLSWLPFPLNMLVVTMLILFTAWMAHQAAVWIQNGCGRLLIKRNEKSK